MAKEKAPKPNARATKTEPGAKQPEPPAKQAEPETRTITGRMLVLTTDGNTCKVETCTMGLLELKTALEVVSANVVKAINERMAAPAPRPEEPAKAE